MIKITDVMSELECYNKLRTIRWSNGQAICPGCSSSNCKKVGQVTEKKPGQRYHCEGCHRHFNDLTDTVFHSSNLPLKFWMCCLYLMGLNTSNRQIAQELGVSEKTAHTMSRKIRAEIRKNRPDPKLSGEVEFDEVYVVAGHKGCPEAVKKRAAKAVGDAEKGLAAGEPLKKRNRLFWEWFSAAEKWFSICWKM